MSNVDDINSLLNDKLFQVIGSTPASIAESLRKIDLKGRKAEGAQIFSIAVFAAAVNKATLENFLAEPRFGKVRPLITAALSIQGRSNMTALTLLGHCFLATELSSKVTFTAEFRKKMGQDHLWAGSLESGSLSDKQRGILKEKKRVTDEDDAKALGNGFLKLVGINTNTMTAREAEFFGMGNTNEPTAPAASSAPDRSSVTGPVTPPRSSTATGKAPATSPTAGLDVRNVRVATSRTESIEVPEDVVAYRRDALGQTESDILLSIERNGLDKFITNTRNLMDRDPTGEKTRNAGSVAR